jgi:hypothetical protein
MHDTVRPKWKHNPEQGLRLYRSQDESERGELTIAGENAKLREVTSDLFSVTDLEKGSDPFLRVSEQKGVTPFRDSEGWCGREESNLHDLAATSS